MIGKEICYIHSVQRGEEKRRTGVGKYNSLKHGFYSAARKNSEKIIGDLTYVEEIQNLKVEISISRYLTSLLTLYLILNEDTAVEEHKGEIRLLLKTLEATTRMLIANKMLSPDGENHLALILDNALDELSRKREDQVPVTSIGPDKINRSNQPGPESV